MSSAQEMPAGLEQKTIQDFGDQWGRYRDNSGFYASLELFRDILGPLLPPEELRGCRAADIGSGTGRIVNMMFAAGVGHVHAVEPAPEAFAALCQNTADHRAAITYHNVRGDELPAGLDLDYVLSIGVIHHIPDPAPTLRACFEALRPGGRCVIWLYGYEGNETYLRVAEPLRRLTVRLPHPVLAGLSRGLGLALDLYIALCRRLPLPLRAYILNVIAPMSRDARTLVIYDQLNPAYAKYYRQAEAESLMRNAGFVDVRTHHRHGYSWTVSGTRPA
jgi:SAM-dependent methyltransferase